LPRIVRFLCKLLYIPFLYNEKIYTAIWFIPFIIIFFLIVLPYNLLGRLFRGSRLERILWAPTPIKQMWDISRGERDLGLKSETLIFQNNIHRIPCDYNIEDWLSETLSRIPVFYAVFLWACMRYDVFHYYYYGGLLILVPIFWQLELPLLRLLGKRIVFSAIGCDIRLRSQAMRHKYNCCSSCSVFCDEKKTRERLDHIKKYASVLVAGGDMHEFLPESKWDVPEYAVDIHEFDELMEVKPPSDKIRIVHGCNNRQWKGTEHIITACEKLKEEGFPVELILVEGKPNEEARRIYATADIIVDQLLIGWYALFSIEAMAMGKPVCCYLREDLIWMIPKEPPCPIVNTNPENILEELRKLVKNPELRKRLGEMGRHYAAEIHDFRKVAQKWVKIYGGE